MRRGTVRPDPCQHVPQTDEGRSRSVKRGGPAGVGSSQTIQSSEKDRFR